MKRYRFKKRSEYEAELAAIDRALLLHRMALDALVREEFTWTQVFKADCGSWFQMGVARAHWISGGIVLVREFYPTNNHWNQSTRWAEEFLRGWREHYTCCPPTDDEASQYRNCFHALCEIHNQLSNVA